MLNKAKIVKIVASIAALFVGFSFITPLQRKGFTVDNYDVFLAIGMFIASFVVVYYPVKYLFIMRLERKKSWKTKLTTLGMIVLLLIVTVTMFSVLNYEYRFIKFFPVQPRFNTTYGEINWRPSDFIHDGVIDEWVGQRYKNIHTLQGEQNGLSTELIYGQTEFGLVIAGKIPPSWQGTWAQTLDDGGSHIDIKMKGANIETPPIGWGHQFGDIVLTNESDCYRYNNQEFSPETCARWYKEQLVHRERVHNLFERQWIISSNFTEEVRALPAYKNLMKDHNSSFTNLNPETLPSVKMFGSNVEIKGTQFEIYIPIEAFPPQNSALIDTVALDVSLVINGERYTDVFGNTHSNMSFELGTYKLVPYEFSISKCHNESEGLSFYLEKQTAYYMPVDNRIINTVFILDMPREGYQYQPNHNSLVVIPTDLYDVELDKNHILCGPMLTLYDVETKKRHDLNIVAYDPGVIPDTVQSYKIADNEYLLSLGPREYQSFFGSGQCGACPRVGLKIYHLKLEEKKHIVQTIFDKGGIVDQGSNDLRYEISGDWGIITVQSSTTNYIEVNGEYTKKTSTNSEKYCLNKEKVTYEICNPETTVDALGK